MRRKIARVQKLTESTAFLTRKVQEFFHRNLVSLVSDFGTKQLRSQHFVKRLFHYQCLDLKYIAPKRIVTNKLKLIFIYDIRLKNLHSFKDLISLDASIFERIRGYCHYFVSGFTESNASAIPVYRSLLRHAQ